jgi:very-short-patch-repair endonuclease
VSFPLRLVIDLVQADESEAAAKARAVKRNWLKAHDYTVLGIFDRDVESDMAAVLEQIDKAIG